MNFVFGNGYLDVKIDINYRVSCDGTAYIVSPYYHAGDDIIYKQTTCFNMSESTVIDARKMFPCCNKHDIEVISQHLLEIPISLPVYHHSYTVYMKIMNNVVTFVCYYHNQYNELETTTFSLRVSKSGYFITQANSNGISCSSYRFSEGAYGKIKELIKVPVDDARFTTIRHAVNIAENHLKVDSA